MIRTCLVACALVALMSTARAEGVEDWLGAPHTSNLVAAARGGRLAFVMSRRGVRNVYVADPPAYKPRPVTRYDQDDGRLITALRLTPDGNTAVFAYGNSASDSGHVNPTADIAGRSLSILAVDVRTGASSVLSDGMEGRCGDPDGCTELAVSSDGVHVAVTGERGIRIATLGAAKPLVLDVRGSAQAPAWSPDGKAVAFTLSRRGHDMIAVYRLGEPSLRYLAPSFDNDAAARWSPDGRQIAFVRAVPAVPGAPLLAPAITPWSIWLADATTGAARELWRSGDRANDSLPELAPPGGFGIGAGGLVYFVSERDGWQHLYVLDAARAEVAPRLLTPGELEVDDVIASADRSSLIYVSNEADIDRRHVWQVALAGGAPRALTRGTGTESRPVRTGDGALFCLAASATQPAMVAPITAQGLGPALTASELPASFARSFVAPQTLTYRSADGTAIHAQLLVPPGAQRHPAVVFLHGGPVRQLFPGFHPMSYYQDAYAMMQYLASRGFVVLAINYRGGIGYGRAFREPKGQGVRGASEYQDVRAAGGYLRTLASVDPRRIGLWGGSYGGFLTALGLARDSELFVAGVNYAGVSDWWTLRGLDGSTAPDAAEARKISAAASPLASLAKWRAPMLVIHGDDDLNVDLSQSITLVAALQRRGVRVEQLVLPDQTHFMQPWSAWVKVYRATGEFLERELQPSR